MEYSLRRNACPGNRLVCKVMMAQLYSVLASTVNESLNDYDDEMGEESSLSEHMAASCSMVFKTASTM
jgi:hypothetical protein